VNGNVGETAGLDSPAAAPAPENKQLTDAPLRAVHAMLRTGEVWHDEQPVTQLN